MLKMHNILLNVQKKGVQASISLKKDLVEKPIKF